MGIVALSGAERRFTMQELFEEVLITDEERVDFALSAGEHVRQRMSAQAEQTDDWTIGEYEFLLSQLPGILDEFYANVDIYPDRRQHVVAKINELRLLVSVLLWVEVQVQTEGQQLDHQSVVAVLKNAVIRSQAVLTDEELKSFGSIIDSADVADMKVNYPPSGLLEAISAADLLEKLKRVEQWHRVEPGVVACQLVDDQGMLAAYVTEVEGTLEIDVYPCLGVAKKVTP